eukprot:jgi/Astpho2/8203/fgenesh1_pg.00120_%23_110_t
MAAKELAVVILDVGFLMERHNLEDAQRALIVHAMLKILNKPTHELGLVLCGTNGTQNPVADEVNDGIQYQHIILEQSLQPPDLMFLTSLKALPLDASGQSDFLYAVVVAIGELKARSEVINQKKSRKRILLISNFLMDLSNMDDALEFARGVSGALTDAGITLEIISIDDVEQDAKYSEAKQCNQEVLQRLSQGVQHVIRHVSKSEQLSTALKMRDTHTAYRSLLFKICDGLDIKVNKKVSEEKLPSTAHYSDMQEGDVGEAPTHRVIRDIEYKSAVTDEVVDLEDRTKAYRDVWMLVPNKDDQQSRLIMSAIVRALADKGQVALIRSVFSCNDRQFGVDLHCASPWLGSDGYPDCLLLNDLPFQEDVRNFSFKSFQDSPLCPSQQQVAHMQALVDSMDLASGGQELLQPDTTANPILSRFISFMADKAVNSDEEVPNAVKDRLVRLLAEPKVNKEADALLKAMSTMFPTHIPKAKTEEEVPEAGTNGVQLLQEGELAADAAMTQVTQVSTADPVADFKQVLEGGQVAQAVQGMMGCILRLLATSMGRYDKPLDCLTVLRGACEEHAGQGDVFNTFLGDLAQNRELDSGHSDFWQGVVSKGITLLAEEEAEGAGISKEEAQCWLQQRLDIAKKQEQHRVEAELDEHLKALNSEQRRRAELQTKLQTVLRRNDELLAQSSRLSDQLEIAMYAATTYEKKLNAGKVQDRGRRLQGDLDAALHNVRLLQQEAEKRQEDAARALCAKEDDCAILNQQLARRSEELTNTKAELQKAAATNGQLSSGLKNAASKFENAQKALVAEQAKASLPEDNMVLLEAQVHCAMQEHEAVRARLLEKENELVSAKGHVSELQCRTVEACATIAGLHKEIEGGAARLLLTEDSLAAAQAASAKQVFKLEASIKEADTTLAAAMATISEKEAENGRLRQRVEEANMKVERQVAELQRSAVDAGKLEGSLSAVQNQLQETQGNLSSVKADLQQATNALTSEQAVQVELKQQYDELCGRAAKTEGELSNRCAEIELLKADVANAGNLAMRQLEEDAARISKLTAETCDLKAELSASKKEAKDAKEREIVELTRGFEKQLQEHDKQAKTDASRRVQQLNDKIGALEADIGKVTKEGEGLAATHKEELQKERSAAKAAQAQLDNVKAEHAAALQKSEHAKALLERTISDKADQHAKEMQRQKSLMERKDANLHDVQHRLSAAEAMLEMERGEHKELQAAHSSQGDAMERQKQSDAATISQLRNHLRQANIEAGAGKTQLEKQRQMMDALEAQLAEKEAALAHITSTAAGNISCPKQKQATVLNRKRVSPTKRPDDPDNSLLNRSFNNGKARAQNGMPPPTSRTQSRLQHSPLRSQQLEQEPDQQSDQQGLKGPPFTQDELEHRDAGADEGCEQELSALDGLGGGKELPQACKRMKLSEMNMAFDRVQHKVPAKPAITARTSRFASMSTQSKSYLKAADSRRRQGGDDSNTAISKASRLKSHRSTLGGDKPSSGTCSDLYQ